MMAKKRRPRKSGTVDLKNTDLLKYLDGMEGLDKRTVRRIRSVLRFFHPELQGIRDVIRQHQDLVRRQLEEERNRKTEHFNEINSHIAGIQRLVNESNDHCRAVRTIIERNQTMTQAIIEINRLTQLCPTGSTGRECRNIAKAALGKAGLK